MADNSGYQTKLGTKSKFRVLDYFDVWGNVRDGFEVNNQRYLDKTIELSDDGPYDPDEIQRELKRIGYWKPSVNRRQWHIDGNTCSDEYVELEDSHGSPVCRLEVIKEGE